LIHPDTLLLAFTLVVTVALGLVCFVCVGGAAVGAVQRLRTRGRAQVGRAHATLAREHTGENAREAQLAAQREGSC
jgi:hypothetical protein